MTASATAPGDERSAPGFAIRELLPTEIEASRTFFGRLDSIDVRMRFASPFSCVRYFIPALAGWADGVALAAVEAEDAIVGVANLIAVGTDQAETTLIVRFDRKRRGVSRALVGAVVERAARIGGKEAAALINSENGPMLALARATGFRIVHRDSFSFEARRRIGGET